MFNWTTWLRQTNMGLRYYLQIDPYDLEVGEWGRRVVELTWFKQQQSKSNNPDV
jgi:hypothetical protein